MTRPDARPLTPDEREQMKQWLDNWSRVGPILEAERCARVQALTDDEAWQEAQGLLAAWNAGTPGDAGEGLLLHQDVFAKWPAAKR
jgi:hypothetical protein